VGAAHEVPGGGRRKVIRVAVVDENDIFRRGLVACLQSDEALRVVFDARTGPVAGVADVVFASAKAAGDLTGTGPPRLICGDPQAPGGLAPEPGRADAVLCRWNLTEEQVLAAVRAAASGLRVQTGRPPRANSHGALSPRMLDVLRLLADGCGTREVSRAIGFSERTVKTVAGEAQRRLGARNRAQAVAEAIRRGLI